MKIIAKTNKGFLLEASKDEIALVLGFRNTFSSNGFTDDMVAIGEDIPVEKIHKVSRFVRTLEKDSLLSIKKNLETTISEIDDAVETTQEITLFETLMEDNKS